ncbi:nicotinamide-nucleotide amidase/nicotinamide-nucleotide amidase [Acetitomaculum ruminis DSM 5522]|uniref:Nicotinamide-nucleotide amidase/nicotinamide-nucleotide amidase n=1 Tax=Acetitomaculum ruminis DSM 5522 TaxID=1120918 RepID=A0A1I0WPA7_9FIRM|nr:CinA family protein [Acetitomaculum ruminis]SFA89813.1 nicotinamide-nucleotide amidase/nicotinamide-nucleotide amidase [Acetitomaculum ruminis DSM 5522]
MKEYIEKNIRKDYEKLTKLLIEKNWTITTMESATSGQIASLITDTSGASAIFKGAFITYSNEAKILNGVDAKVIEKYSVYSKETAIEMAKACKKAYNSKIGIGVTGTMGNIDPANKEASIPGEVDFAFDIDGKITNYHISLKPQPTRLLYKMAVAKEVYDSLMTDLGKLI